MGPMSNSFICMQYDGVYPISFHCGQMQTPVPRHRDDQAVQRSNQLPTIYLGQIKIYFDAIFHTSWEINLVHISVVFSKRVREKKEIPFCQQ